MPIIILNFINIRKHLRKLGGLAVAPSLVGLATAGLLFLTTAPAAKAADGTWNVDQNRWWTDGSAWVGNISANGTDSTATFPNIFNNNRTVSLNQDRTLGYMAFQDTSHNLTITPLAGQILTLDVTSGTADISVSNGSRTLFINTIIAGNDGFSKSGAGTLALSANNTNTGAISINQGTVAISHANALGTTAGATTIAATGSSSDGGILKLSGGITSAENIIITGGGEASGQFGKIIDNTDGSNTLSGDITLNSPTGNIRIGASSGTLTLSGNVSQTGGTTRDLRIQASGSSSVIVSNPIANNGGNMNIYSNSGSGTGTVTLNGVSGSGLGNARVSQNGTLVLGVTDALSISGDLTLGASGGNDVGTFDLAGFDQTINALGGQAGSNPNTSRKITNSAAGTGTSTLTVGNGNGSGTFNGVMVDGATAKVALVKTGTGTQTLADASTYSGGTVVNAGTLLVNNATGSGTGTGSVMVNGGILGGTGILGGEVTVNGGGTLSPGVSPGILQFDSNLTLGGILNMEINGTTAGLFDVLDGIDSTGMLNLGGTLNITTGYIPTLGDTITLFPNWGSINPGFDTVTQDLTGFIRWDTSSLSTGTLTAAVIPEPGTFGLLGLFGLLAMMLRRLRGSGPVH